MTSNFDEKIAICYICSGETYRDNVLQKLNENYYSDSNLYYFVLTDDKSFFKDVQLDNFVATELKDFYDEFPDIKEYEYLLEAKDKSEYAEKFVESNYKFPISIMRFLLLQAYRAEIKNVLLIVADTIFRLERFTNDYLKVKNRTYNAISEWDAQLTGNSMHIIADILKEKFNLTPDPTVRILDACARLFVFENLEDAKRLFDIWNEVVITLFENKQMHHFHGSYANNDEFILAPIYNVLGLNKQHQQAGHGMFEAINNSAKDRFWLIFDEKYKSHTNYEEFLRINNLTEEDIKKM